MLGRWIALALAMLLASTLPALPTGGPAPQGTSLVPPTLASGEGVRLAPCTPGYNGTCPALTPSISSTPAKICIYDIPYCPLSQDVRVTLTVTATGTPVNGSSLAATGTAGDAFNFIPSANFEIDPQDPQWIVSCSLGPSSPPIPGPCSPVPDYSDLGPNTGVGWSWPSNSMYIGDTWSVAFNVVAKPAFPPNLENIPQILDACVGSPVNPWSSSCVAFAGGSSVDYSSVDYVPYNSTIALGPPQSFPPAWVTVVGGTNPLWVFANASNDLGEAPIIVNFTTTVGGGAQPWTFSWDFADGGASSEQDPSHTYTSAGMFNANVTVNDSSGRTASAVLTVYVFAPLRAYLNCSQGGHPLSNGSSVQLGSTIALQGGSSGGVPSSSVQWLLNGTVQARVGDWWNFTASGDGAYTLGLRATDGLGDVRTATVDLQVVGVRPTLPPLAVVLVANRSRLPVGGSVTFNVSITGGLAPYLVVWDLDGVNTSWPATTVEVRFGLAGDHTMLVWATDSEGRTAVSNVVALVVGSPPSKSPAPTNKTSAGQGWTNGIWWGLDLGLSVALLVLFSTWIWEGRRRRRPQARVTPPRPGLDEAPAHPEDPGLQLSEGHGQN